MKTKRVALKTASVIAAAALLAAVPVSMPKGAFTSAPMTAYADYQSLGDFYYSEENGEITITGSNPKAASAEIPATINGKPVTAIGDYAFNGSSISSVTIPDSVRTIGNYTFTMCSNLKSVTLPESIEYIGIRAFELCSSLSEVNFPDHMIDFSSKVFDSTPWMTAQRQKSDLVVVNGVLIDAENATGDIVLSSDIKAVASGTFERNDKITSVVFPSSIKKLKDNVFFYCSNLTSADIRYVTEIESMAFAYCNKLTDLKLSGKLTKIDGYGFADVTSRASITVYGSKSDWDKVEKNENDPFLRNASYTFDESFVEPEDDIEGDVNADGKFNTSDLVVMNQWLVGNPDSGMKNWKAGDMDTNNKLDGFDLCLMRTALLSK